MLAHIRQFFDESKLITDATKVTAKAEVILSDPDKKAGATGSAFKVRLSVLLAAALAAVGSLRSKNATGGIGYAAGAGGVVIQETSKSTEVALNTVTGEITMNGAALADAANVTFTVTNTAVEVTDIPVVIHKSAGTAGAYQVTAHSPIAGTSFKITVRNVSGGSLSQAIVLSFGLIRGAVA